MGQNFWGVEVTREPETPTKVYRLSTLFPIERWEQDLGMTDVVLPYKGNGYMVELDPEGYKGMLDHATHVWECRYDFEDDLMPLCESARRVRDNLKKAGPPC